MNEKFKESTESSIQSTLKGLKKDIEQGNKPGVVNYLKESKDGKYNIYSYILAQGGTKGGIKSKYEAQIGPRVEGTQFTDANGDPINKDRFSSGEIVYLRVPKKRNAERTNSVPEMTRNDIMKLSNKEIIELSGKCSREWARYGNGMMDYKDGKGNYYTKINGKKVYTSVNYQKVKSTEGAILNGDCYEGGTSTMTLTKKEGNRYYGIYVQDRHGGNFWDYDDEDKVIYRGELVLTENEGGTPESCFKPKDYKDRAKRNGVNTLPQYE